jgi:outer membrane protein assembly factor BamB
MLESVRADDWLTRRGPTSNGLSKESKWTNQWPESGPPIRWRANVGTGFSSVTTQGNRLFTLGNVDNQESIHCLDTQTGKSIWQHTYECAIDDRFFEGGPTSTPTIDGDCLYSLSRQGDLICCNAETGKVVWSKNVAVETSARVPGWGFSSSPVVLHQHLLLGVGDAGLLLNKADGEILWQSGKGEAGYMTPQVVPIDGRPHALIASGKFFQCVDLESGAVKWKHRWLTTYGCNAADPIVLQNRVFISSGYGRGATVLEFNASESKVVWANKEMQNQLNSSVLIEGCVFGFDGNEDGEVLLKCLEFATGKALWSTPGLGSGSLMAADGKLIVLSENGELLIAPASSTEFNPTARAQVLDGKCWTVPVLSNQSIYCRSAAGDLVCVDVQISEAK